MITQELISEKLTGENAEKIIKLLSLGFQVDYDEEYNTFKIYSVKDKSEFFTLSENRLLKGFKSKYPLDLVSFYNVKRSNPYKVLSKFKKLSVSSGKTFKNDQQALENLPRPEEMTGGINFLFENRNRAVILKVLVPDSDVAEKILKIYDSFIDYGYLEMPPIVEYDMKKEILAGDDMATYIPYASISLLSKDYSGKKLKYTLYPYAPDGENVGKGKIKIIYKNEEYKDDDLDPDLKELMMRVNNTI